MRIMLSSLRTLEKHSRYLKYNEVPSYMIDRCSSLLNLFRFRGFSVLAHSKTSEIDKIPDLF